MEKRNYPWGEIQGHTTTYESSNEETLKALIKGVGMHHDR